MTRGIVQLLIRKKGQDWKLVETKDNLLTNGGRDFYHNQGITNTSTGTIGANYIGLTETSFSPAATDTTLTGEISTNGLSRAQATTITHTSGTNQSTLTKTFTASGSFTSVLASALFNASSSGIMTHEANFTTGSGTLISGDSLQVSWTINMG